jgi:hypothetical protein
MTQNLLDSPKVPVVQHAAWLALKDAVESLRPLQSADGSIDGDTQDLAEAARLTCVVVDSVLLLAPRFPYDQTYLATVVQDLRGWVAGGFAVPDFLDALLVFQPQNNRVDGLEHLVVFSMYTQNGNPDRNLEAVLLRVVWPDWIAAIESGEYGNKAFVPVAFTDFTSGYDTNSAVLFPETISVREVPVFTWGAIFCDREAARFRRVTAAVVAATSLELPADAEALLADQELAKQVYVLWDLIHDRTHSRGDLPFDPFMIKQRMPFWLYSLEELRCDLTAFRAAVELAKEGVPHAKLAQYAILFDRAFRFPLTGNRVRNYDGLGGQLLFAYLHQNHVMQWTDNRLLIDWVQLPGVVLALLAEIEELYWRSIDRPKVAHWIAAYQLVTNYVEPNPASVWAKGVDALPIDGPPKGLTDAVLPDEFPLSMFFEALSKRVSDVIVSTKGITA